MYLVHLSGPKKAAVRVKRPQNRTFANIHSNGLILASSVQTELDGAARRSRCGSSAVADASASPPDGSEIAPASKPQPDGALVKALA
jgi:hypothetical protein